MKVIEVSDGLNMEYLFLEIILPDSKILLGAVYKAPNVDEIDVLDTKLSEFSSNYTDFLLVGDFNENLLRN